MGFYDQINHLKFTNAEKVIIQYILKNPQSSLCMTASELARSSFSSSATVVRLCKKLGYEGFDDFKIKFYSELQNGSPQNIDPNFPVLEHDEPLTISTKLKNLYLASIQESYSALDFTVLNKCVDIIEKSASVDIYGNLNSLFYAYDFQFKCERIGKKCFSSNYPGGQFFYASHSDSTHCALIISYTGETEETLSVAKICKLNKTPIIAITSNPNSQLANLCDLCVLIPQKELLYPKIGSFSSKICINFYLDTIFCMLFERNYTANMNYYMEHSMHISMFKAKMAKVIQEKNGSGNLPWDTNHNWHPNHNKS